MRIALLYFTGTYNTLYITTLIKNRLKNLKHDVDVFLLDDKLKFNYKKYDIIGIGYPIYAFNAPKYVETIIKKINIKEKKYFIYKNSGEPFKYNNASSFKLYKILKRNKNIMLSEYHFVMPYNILFKTKEEFVNYEMNYNLKYIKYLCDNINKYKPYNINLFERFISFIFKVQRIGANVNIKFYKVDKSKCVRCRKCIQSCPMHNIKYNREKRKIVFNNSNCLMCMRCSFNCPSNAISIGLLNSKKVNGPYDFNSILNKKYDYDFSLEKDKFYKKFKPYFDYIDSLNVG